MFTRLDETMPFLKFEILAMIKYEDNYSVVCMKHGGSSQSN
jgi:hypothetical protein